MAFPRRFFRIFASFEPFPEIVPASVFLGLLGCFSVLFPFQNPAIPPSAKPPLQPPSSPAPPARPSGESTPGVLQIQDLLASLSRFDRDGRDPARKLGFELPEKTVNEYLAYALRTNPRPGVSGLTVTLLPGNDVSAQIEIDFDSLQKWNRDLIPELLRPALSGKRILRVTAHFEASAGAAKVTLKEAFGPDGNPLPKKLLTDLMQSIGTRQPESVEPDRSIPLPFGIKRLWTEKQLICGET